MPSKQRKPLTVGEKVVYQGDKPLLRALFKDEPLPIAHWPGENLSRLLHQG